MSKRARHDLILELVDAQGRVHVADVSQRLNVSEMTVRRDLEALEEAGLVARVHGGAVTTRSRSYEPGYTARSLRNQELKDRIGHSTAELIGEGETVILDGGSTVLAVANALRGRRGLRVMTVSLRAADVLADEPGISLMLPGGLVRPHERSLIGQMTKTTLDDLYFDTYVMSAGGVDLRAGVTEYDPDDADTKRNALRNARRTILVADHSKFGQVAFARVCGMTEVDTVVTDARPGDDLLQAIRQDGIAVAEV